MLPISHIDARDLKCPAPFIKAQKALNDLGAGGLVAVESDDPYFPPDCESWCVRTGHELVQIGERNGFHLAIIRRRV